MNKTNNQNVEGHNDKNQKERFELDRDVKQFGGIDQFEFLAIRDAVLKVNHRMKDQHDKKYLTEAWLKLERAWYKALSEDA